MCIVKILTKCIKVMGMVVTLKGITKIGIWSLLGILFGVLFITIANKIERNYI